MIMIMITLMIMIMIYNDNDNDNNNVNKVKKACFWIMSALEGSNVLVPNYFLYLYKCPDFHLRKI